MAVAAPLAAYPLTLGERSPAWLLALGAGGAAVALVGGVVRLSELIGLGIAGLVVEYAIAADELDAALDGRAVLWAAGLFVFAELLFLVEELGSAARPARELLRRRLGGIAAVVTASIVAGAVVLALTTVESPTGLAFQAAGVVAAVGTLALLLTLVRR